MFDILKGKKKEERKPKRLKKGALKRAKKPVEKREEIKLSPLNKKDVKKKESQKITKIKKDEQSQKSGEMQPAKTAQLLLASEFILRPHITEQSTFLANQNVYTFRVSPSANKIIIKKAIKEMYGFEPVKIRVVNVPLKKRIIRGKIGIKSGYKKALVYLKEGDKIEFI